MTATMKVTNLQNESSLTPNIVLNADGTTTIAATTATALTTSGNLTFTGTGNRITGDFSNATFTNRVSFQSSTSNGATVVQLIPNGTSTASQIAAYGGSDILNTSVGQLTNNGTDVRFASGIFGTGTYLPMTFYTGGSERFRVNTSGNVGIGTASPSQKLQIANSTATDTQVGITNSLSTLKFSSFGDGTSGIETTGNYAQRFFTNSAERMRIDNIGNLLVARSIAYGDGTLGTPVFQVNGIVGSRAAAAFIATSAGAINLIGFVNSNGTVGSIYTAGSSTIYNTSSDYRLKENVTPMTGALAKVQQLKPCTYTWKADGSVGQGFIAHELQEVVPDCVTGTKDAVDKDGKPQYQGVDTSFLVATIVAALQEQQAMFTELKAEFDAYKAEHP